MRIFLAIPTYGGQVSMLAFQGILCSPKQGAAYVKADTASLLAYGFNRLWCEALNRRKTDSITHFCMLHSDIIPKDPQNWLNILKEEMVATGADIMSTIIPIKDARGLTSTALDMSTPENTWAVKRFTMSEIMAMPETFTDRRILMNTGCWLADITKPWAEKVHFEINDVINQKENGDFVALVEPEDWNFSKQVKANGGLIYVTRKVKLSHKGSFEYVNDEAWGQEVVDEFYEASLK